MVDKFSEACLGPLKIGKRHHRGRGGAIATNKHWELVHEVSDGRLGSSLSVINLCGKKVDRHFQLVDEIAHLIGFGFQVFEVRVTKNKIEHSDAPLNVFEFVFSAVAKVLPGN